MNAEVKLSDRLKKIASFIQPGTHFADIGSDHAYLPCYVCLQDETIRAIAGEVRNGPFLRAKETVEHFQLEQRIDVRLGNGLEVIKQEDEVNTVVVAGMGGTLISNIIHEGREKLTSVNRLILQPNTNSYVVRKTFIENKFSLIEEIILEENHHIYEILVAEKNDTINVYNEKEEFDKQLLFGPILMKERSKTFIKKWQNEREKLHTIIEQMEKASVRDEKKLAYFKRQLRWIEEVLI